MVNLLPLLLCVLPADCNVLFVGKYCPPCHTAQRRLAREDVIVIDINDEPELAKKFNIQAKPTLVVIRDNKEVTRLEGLKTLREYQEVMNYYGQEPAFTGVIYFAGETEDIIVKGILRRVKRLGKTIKPGTAELVEKYGVTCLPTFIFVQDGKEVGRYTGVTPISK